MGKVTGKNGHGHKRPKQNARGLQAMVKWLNANVETGHGDWQPVHAQQIFNAVDAARGGLPEQAEVPMQDVPPLSERHEQLLGDMQLAGTALALAQSLKVMGDVCEAQGAHGHAVIARRARQFVQLAHMHVTRFLFQPDLRLRHVSVDLDLVATHVDVNDTGKVTVHCTDPDGGGWWTFAMDELVPAGPVNDALRAMATALSTQLVHNAIGEAITAGKLPGLAGVPGTDPRVHDYGADQYGPIVNEPPVAVGFEPPPGDEAFQAQPPDTPQRHTHCWECGAPLVDGLCSNLDSHGLVGLRQRDRPCWEGTPMVAVDHGRPGGDHTVEVAYVRDPADPSKVIVHHLQVHDHYRLEGGRAVPE